MIVEFFEKGPGARGTHSLKFRTQGLARAFMPKPDTPTQNPIGSPCLH